MTRHPSCPASCPCPPDYCRKQEDLVNAYADYHAKRDREWETDYDNRYDTTPDGGLIRAPKPFLGWRKP